MTDLMLGALRDRSFDPSRGRFRLWLFTCARNRCLMERRKRVVRDRAASELRAQEPAQQPVEEAMERATRVRSAMAELPEAQRHLLLLKQIGELTYKEIGEATTPREVVRRPIAEVEPLGDPALKAATELLCHMR